MTDSARIYAAARARDLTLDGYAKAGRKPLTHIEALDAVVLAAKAEAWDEGFDASEVWSSSQPGESMPTNPYRSPATTKGNADE